MTEETAPRAVVRRGEKVLMSFGEFLKATKEARRVNVTHLVRTAGLSRANYYHLESDKQAPSLPTAIALLAALGMETRVPAADDSKLDVDLGIVDGEKEYELRIAWSDEDRRRARAKAARFVSSAAPGLSAVAVIPGALPLAAGAVAGAAAVLYLRERANEIGAVHASPDEELERRVKAQSDSIGLDEDSLRDEIRRAAENLSREELKAVLEAIVGLREAEPDLDR
jgi:transcriptional regulator with XRE-family HTH domain